MRHNVTIEEAQNLLVNAAAAVKTTMVSLDSASGRVLGETAAADYYVPPFNRSAMDGYAVIAGDTVGAMPEQPIILRVEADGASTPGRAMARGAAVKVMTGEPIPEGADTVVKYEEVRRQGDTLAVYRALPAGENVVPLGEDMKPGDTIAREGTLITPAVAAVLAGQGKGRVRVYRRVRVAICNTGDELLHPSEGPRPGKVYNSIYHGLAARCRELGARPVDLGITPDDVEETVRRIASGLERADLVVITGGVSVGEYDVVEDSLQGLGAEYIFRRVLMKPGSPMLAARKDGKIIVGLSGNPAAAMISFELIVAPLIRRLMGLRKTTAPRFQGEMVDGFKKASPQRRLLRAQLVRQDGKNLVRLTGAQTNGVLKSMIHCNALVDIPAGSGPVSAGQPVTGFLIGRVDQADGEETAWVPMVVPGRGGVGRGTDAERDPQTPWIITKY
ncbi:MAG: molybdopterin molybdotransferase MoeA [Firmicutes bacterium]|nr:molybdopterin molybdotransferase MoeA [Bacillota bacterium]